MNPRSATDREFVQGYWAIETEELLRRLASGRDGLPEIEAARRLQVFGPNRLVSGRTLTRLQVLLSQLKSPLLLLLVFAASASVLTGEWVDALIVLLIVVATVTIGYMREYSAQTAAAALQARVRTRTRTLRDGHVLTVPLEDVVPGDIIELSAGSLVPGDAVVLDCADFFVSEAVLTGESFPVEKKPGVVDAKTALPNRTNCVFLGTNVRSGSAQCIVVLTGGATEFGTIADRLKLRPPETEFDRGIRRFGYFLTVAMLIAVLFVFLAHVLQGRPPIETLLFAVALAVGLSPELLPAILSTNLSRGAQMMARQGVLVRRLNAIENLGSMDVLCTDKTGTLTQGVVQMEGAYDTTGSSSQTVLHLGALNAGLAKGLANPLDDAILQACRPDLSNVHKLAEIPFDFVRKRATVVVEDQSGIHLVTKGAFDHVLDVCTRASDGSPLDAGRKRESRSRYEKWCGQGVRVVAVATRELDRRSGYGREDESDLTLAGFLTFFDHPKEDVATTLVALGKLGVSVKVISGDSQLVVQHVASLVGMRADRVLTGPQMLAMSDEALWNRAEDTDLFAEVDPSQKERIILALKKMGHVVGFLGDGVNDAPAMHAADTSLSVDQAVDVARETADFVLLERDLDVIRCGIEEGRRTFANTLKYILTTTSANLGNMASMAIASLFLPFLPLLASQILLNNFLSDVPAVGLATDNVDPELVERPGRWDIGFIGRFMLEFGAVSSLFDFATFGVLLRVFKANVELFRTGWFVESLLTELVIALVVRTRRPFFRSRPGLVLLSSSLTMIALTFLIPFLPFMSLFGLVPVPGAVLATLAAITGLYVLATELAKHWFFRHRTMR